MNPSASHHRFIANLAESELFKNYQHAFHTLTGLPLNLNACEELDGNTTVEDVRGVKSTMVPVRVGKNVVAALQTGGVRLQQATPETFAPVARQMLDENCSVEEIHAARTEFESLRIMSEKRYTAALDILSSFALQMGESAHRFLFAHASREPDTIRRAKVYIHDHLAEAMTLDTVAKAVAVSPFHFCKIFKQATGFTFTDFVSHARIEKAKRLLMKPSARITDVAYDVGFQSLSHFNRCFRRIASESPTEYRARMKTLTTNPRQQALAA